MLNDFSSSNQPQTTNDQPQTSSSNGRVKASPLAKKLASEKGIDISEQRPKNVDDYLGRLPVSYLVIVCDGANEKCPRVFPGMMNRMFFGDRATG